MKKIKNIIFINFVIVSFFMGMNVAYARSIKDGTYVIKSAFDENKVIDLYKGYTRNETNIQLYTNNGSNNQKWVIKYDGDGYYNIASSLDTNMAIDIYRGLFANKSNIQLYSNNHGNNQKWAINYVGNGYYSIVSKNSNYCMDINGGIAANETNIQIYKCNNTLAQKFKLVEVIDGKQTIEDGTYIISTALDDKKAIDVNRSTTVDGTNIEIYSNNGTNNQKWDVKYLDNGYYQIVTKLDNSKCMDVVGENLLPGDNVQLYTCDNSDSQKWIIKDVGDGYYNLITAGNHVYLDVYKGLAINGNNIQVYFGNDGFSQKFKLTKIDNKVLESGIYTINTALNKDKALEVYSGNNSSDELIKLNDSQNVNKQKFYIEKLEDGYYVIKSALDSNFYLSITDEASLKLSKTEFQWKITFVDYDQFYIIPKTINKYLSVNDNSGTNGTTLSLLSTNTTSSEQKFVFKETEINSNDRTVSDGYYLIKTALDYSMGLDLYRSLRTNETNIGIYSLSNTKNQLWYFKYLENGYYCITSALNRATSVDLSSGSTTDGTNIQLYKANNTDNQIWRLKDDGNGNLSIISKKAEVCLTVDGTNVESNSCNYEREQKFRLDSFSYDLVYTGIDVSQYQREIDWEKVANANIGFVILRLGYGDNWTSQDDTMFLENVTGCEKYNIPYGVYIYSYAKNIDGSTALNVNSESAASEAAHVMRLLNKVSYKPNLKTAVYIDMEEPTLEYLGKSKLTGIADKFCSVIEGNGYGCGIYANKSWLNNYLDAKTLANKYDIWIAEWTSNSTSPTFNQAMALKPSYNLTNYKLWQFSSKGSINGISGYVDVDLGYNIFD